MVEEFRGEEMSLIDDEEGEAIFASQVAQRIAQLWEQTGEGVGRFLLQGEQDLRVKSGDIEARIGQIDRGVEITVERMDEGAEGG